MTEQDFLAGRFEEHRSHLRAVAYKLLGSPSEADDAVQDTWLRLARTDVTEVDNLGGWLTTVVARVALNMLRSRSTRGEVPLDAPGQEAVARDDPERDAVLADSVGVALLVVLDALAPAERLAFVLHDMFAVPYEEIAPIVDKSPAATRQLASRARRRVQGAPADATRAASASNGTRQREIVDAFLAAARGGQFEALVALLDPDVVLHADRAAVLMGATGLLRGAATVAGSLSGRARGARLAQIDGLAGLVWAPGGRPRVAFAFTVSGARIVEIELIGDAEHLAALEVALGAP